MRIPGLLLAVPVLVAGGCTCSHGSSEPPGAAASASAAGTASGVAGSSSAGPSASAPRDAAVFSAPIAAVRTGHADVVAGLVAADGVVRAMGMADGKVAWAADVLRGVSWSPDVEIHMRPAGDGAAL